MKRGHCPQCERPLDAASQPWRPFCSERCKLIDLGQWFAGAYAIPDDQDDPDAPPEPAAPSAHKPRQ